MITTFRSEETFNHYFTSSNQARFAGDLGRISENRLHEIAYYIFDWEGKLAKAELARRAALEV